MKTFNAFLPFDNKNRAVALMNRLEKTGEAVQDGNNTLAIIYPSSLAVGLPLKNLLRAVYIVNSNNLLE